MISFFLLFLNTDPALLLPPEAEMDDIAILTADGVGSCGDLAVFGLLVNQKALDSYTIAREVIRI